MNEGQQRFYDFVMARVREGKKDKNARKKIDV
jgi:hypothetical protein